MKTAIIVICLGIILSLSLFIKSQFMRIDKLSDTISNHTITADSLLSANIYLKGELQSSNNKIQNLVKEIELLSNFKVAKELHLEDNIYKLPQELSKIQNNVFLGEYSIWAYTTTFVGPDSRKYRTLTSAQGKVFILDSLEWRPYKATIDPPISTILDGTIEIRVYPTDFNLFINPVPPLI